MIQNRLENDLKKRLEVVLKRFEQRQKVIDEKLTVTRHYVQEMTDYVKYQDEE